MFTPEAIEALRRPIAADITGQALRTAWDAKAAAMIVPDGMKLQKLEHLYPLRHRPRGVMTTHDIDSFVDHFDTHKSDGATVFVNGMSAVAILNLGTPTEPGHADDKMLLDPKETAAYSSLLDVAGPRSNNKTQTELAEWLEDWSEWLTVQDPSGESMSVAVAAAAVRAMTIDSAKKATSIEGVHEVERGAMESVRASSGAGPLPAMLTMQCQPTSDLWARKFKVRVRVVIVNDKTILFKLDIAMLDAHKEEMEQEFCELLQGRLMENVRIGAYTPSA